MSGRNNGQGPKLYVIHLENDHNEWGWVKVLPNKKQAMSFARTYVEGNKKRVVYLPEDKADRYIEYDAKEFVVVCQQSSFYVDA